MAKKFIMDREVSKIDGELVTFKDGKCDTYPEFVLESIVSDKAQSMTQFAEAWMSPCVREIVDIINKYDLPFDIEKMIPWKIVNILELQKALNFGQAFGRQYLWDIRRSDLDATIRARKE